MYIILYVTLLWSVHFKLEHQATVAKVWCSTLRWADYSRNFSLGWKKSDYLFNVERIACKPSLTSTVMAKIK